MERRNFLELFAVAGMGAAAVPLARAAQTGAHPKPAYPASGLVITPDQAHVYNMGQGEAHILVDGERSGGAWWLGQFREDPGFVTVLHTHPHTDEQFYVLDGVLTVYLDGRWHDLKPGALAVVPRGAPHAQGNVGKQPVHFLGSGNPAGFEQFFAALHKLMARISPSDPQLPDKIGKVMIQYDAKILGPPPPRP